MAWGRKCSRSVASAGTGLPSGSVTAVTASFLELVPGVPMQVGSVGRAPCPPCSTAADPLQLLAREQCPSRWRLSGTDAAAHGEEPIAPGARSSSTVPARPGGCTTSRVTGHSWLIGPGAVTQLVTLSCSVL